MQQHEAHQRFETVVSNRLGSSALLAGRYALPFEYQWAALRASPWSCTRRCVPAPDQLVMHGCHLDLDLLPYSSAISLQHPDVQYIEGTILKESETLKAWNERYAVLMKRELCYWNSLSDRTSGAEPRATISLANCRVCYVAGADHPAGTILIATPTSDKKRLAAQLGQSRIFIRSPSHELGPEWLRRLRIASRECWCLSSDMDTCRHCEAALDGIFRWRHTCRRCGELFCNSHSRRSQTMRDFGYDQPVRVCDACYGAQGPVMTVEKQVLAQDTKRVADGNGWVERLSHASYDVSRARRSEAAADAGARKALLRYQHGPAKV